MDLVQIRLDAGDWIGLAPDRDTHSRYIPRPPQHACIYTRGLFNIMIYYFVFEFIPL
jgi:hypothetical protein